MKKISCSTQLSMKFFLLIIVKMPTIVGILTFMSRKNSGLGFYEPEKCWISWYFLYLWALKISCSTEFSMKKVYNLGSWLEFSLLANRESDLLQNVAQLPLTQADMKAVFQAPPVLHDTTRVFPGPPSASKWYAGSHVISHLYPCSGKVVGVQTFCALSGVGKEFGVQLRAVKINGKRYIPYST